MRDRNRRKRVFAHARAICGGAVPLLFGTGSFALQPDEPPPDVLARQQAQFDADVSKTILELQPFRSESHVTTTGADGVKGTATLVNLNPYVGTKPRRG